MVVALKQMSDSKNDTKLEETKNIGEGSVQQSLQDSVSETVSYIIIIVITLININ